MDDFANWRRLRRGMSMKEVRALLGVPERVAGGTLTTWSWLGAYVTFSSEKRFSWNEPWRFVQRAHPGRYHGEKYRSVVSHLAQQGRANAALHDRISHAMKGPCPQELGH